LLQKGCGRKAGLGGLTNALHSTATLLRFGRNPRGRGLAAASDRRALYEIIQVYGMPLKAVIQEKFGDGIMSAIDFTLQVEKEADPKGERVKLTMSGKCLPYKKW
jgi:hypothetical protein